MSAELTALDYQIRLHTRLAETHADMADHFDQSAAYHREEAARYQAERDAFLGQLGVTNVIPLVREDGGGLIA